MKKIIYVRISALADIFRYFVC